MITALIFAFSFSGAANTFAFFACQLRVSQANFYTLLCPVFCAGTVFVFCHSSARVSGDSRAKKTAAFCRIASIRGILSTASTSTRRKQHMIGQATSSPVVTVLSAFGCSDLHVF